MAEAHLLAGFNGAGKTTLARELARTLPAVRFSLDEWVLRLHGTAFDDPAYPVRAAACRELIWDTAADVLRADASVVLDWNCWSRTLRRDAVQRAEALGVGVHLHHVQTSVPESVRRASGRSEPWSHRLDESGIRHLAERLFEPPTSDEGFVLHRS